MITVFPPMYAEGYRPTMGDESIGLVYCETRPSIVWALNMRKAHEKRHSQKKEKA